ncbi:MAG: hypothetical protein ACE5KU_05245 [Nitrososphaerales archaeon]
MTGVEDIIKHIPQQVTSPLHKTLIDVILKSKNAQALPPSLAKSILNLYHVDRLSSPEGFKTLLESSILLEREKTAEKLQELNLNEAAAKVKGE